jgi:MFS transporter, FHS family, L-fucose permease
LELFQKYKSAFILTFGLFALWGMGHRLYGTLLPDFARAFELDSAKLVLTQNIYSLVYIVFAIPAALYARSFGTKSGIVLGLGCWCVGAFLFYPAALQHNFPFFLFAAVVMSCGSVAFEIAANPWVAKIGPPATTTRRLNFAHALYPLGALAGLYLGRWVILYDLALPVEKLANAVVKPFMVLGVSLLLLAFFAENIRFPPFSTERKEHKGALIEIRRLLSRPLFLAALAAQVCNIAAMSGTWAMCPSYIQAEIPGTSTASVADFLLWSLIIFAIGRFVGIALMYRFDPDRLLAAFAGSGMVFGVLAISTGGEIGAYAMVASSFSMSIMFATILGAAIRDLGSLTKLGTALVYMCGMGGVLGVSLMHLIWSYATIRFTMLVPTLCYAGVVVFALINRRAASVRHTGAAVRAAE